MSSARQTVNWTGLRLRSVHVSRSNKGESSGVTPKPEAPLPYLRLAGIESRQFVYRLIQRDQILGLPAANKGGLLQRDVLNTASAL